MTSCYRPLVLGLVFLLAACTSTHLPRVKVAKPGLSAPLEGGVRDQRLSAMLERAETSVNDLPGAREAYNEAVKSFVLDLQRRVSPRDWKQPLRIQGKTHAWTVTFDDRPAKPQGQGEYSPARFDRLIPDHAFRLEDYHTHVAGAGVGAPVVLARESDLDQLRAERTFRAGNGLYAPGTVVLEFGKRLNNHSDRPVRLRILNTQQEHRVKLAGAHHALAYNHTCAIEASVGNDYIIRNGIRGLLNPARHQKDLGLFGIAAYDPRKIPVVFVHGLGSACNIWSNEVNEIIADPKLNARYQPLLFIYPSGMSVPGAAARLRESLLAYRKHWDPDQSDRAFNRMVIVGHSMGGLLARLQVSNTGEELRQAFFTRPIHEITWMDEQEKQLMQSRLVLKPLPFVERVVFIAVPHRGSKIADFRLVQHVVRLIKLPTTTLSVITKAVTTGGMQFINPELFRYRELGMRSVDMLSPEHPYFKALERCPITVPYHSIIGDRGKGLGPKCSDGVVPYESSHLKGAVTEALVPHWHGCVEKTETVAEVLRILRELEATKSSMRARPKAQ
ncbi:MAG: esterase/lipase family protein [Verrucomicrobiaceae bacterium]